MGRMKPKFRLKTSKEGKKILTVWYIGRGWQEAIDAGLSAYNLSAADRRTVQIIAKPLKGSAEMHG
jgi:hypothetical protein